MKEKLIYEAKYPPIDYFKQYKIDKADVMKNPDTKNLSADEFLKGIYANTHYTPIPKREEISEEYIKEAIRVSKLYQIDAKIIQNEYKISVYLSFDFGGDMKYISHLFGMADSISFFKDNSERDFAVCLGFYTHVVVKNGIAVAP